MHALPQVQECKVTGEPNCRCDIRNPAIYVPEPRDTMRKLFTDHAVYMKMFMNSYLDDIGNAHVLKTRLLQNQIEIGQYLSNYVGLVEGTSISVILKDHIEKAIRVIKDLRDGRDVSADVQSLFQNSDDVAMDISDLSDTLEYETVREEFYYHNQYIVDMSTEHFNREYEQEIKTYDAYYTHMLKFSDLVTEGLIIQNSSASYK